MALELEPQLIESFDQESQPVTAIPEEPLPHREMYFHFKPAAKMEDRSGYYNSKIEMMLAQNTRSYPSKKGNHKPATSKNATRKASCEN
jgi:hypothetical protein